MSLTFHIPRSAVPEPIKLHAKSLAPRSTDPLLTVRYPSYVSATFVAWANNPMSDLVGDENADMPLHEADRPAEPPSRTHLSRTIRRTISSDYTNVLLVFVPIGIAAGTFGWPAQAVFVLNFLAVIPLAPLITLSINEMSPIVGHSFGELMKPASDNVVEMIVRYLYPNAAVWFALF
jgi:hypothetical protein